MIVIKLCSIVNTITRSYFLVTLAVVGLCWTLQCLIIQKNPYSTFFWRLLQTKRSFFLGCISSGCCSELHNIPVHCWLSTVHSGESSQDIYCRPLLQAGCFFFGYTGCRAKLHQFRVSIHGQSYQVLRCLLIVPFTSS